jgi:hypothetical protein
MLRISQEQMSAFRKALTDRMDSRLLEHAHSTYPDVSRIFGPECIAQLVQLSRQKAVRYLLASEGAHRLIFRLILECGVSFDTDPMIEFPGPILSSRELERERVAKLAAAANQYWAQTAPAMRAAALNFRNFRTIWPDRLPPDQHLADLRQSCFALYPEKASLLPDRAWQALFEEATAAAATHGLATPTAHAVLFALFFLAGAGLFVDPRFAFISSVTTDTRPDPGISLHQVAAGQFERWFAHNQ